MSRERGRIELTIAAKKLGRKRRWWARKGGYQYDERKREKATRREGENEWNQQHGEYKRKERGDGV